MELCNLAEKNLIIALKRYPGPRYATSAQELAAHLKTSDRQVRAMISHLRKDHKLPICSTPNEGFFWPRNRKEAAHTIACFRSREASIAGVREGIEDGLEEMFGQMSLFELEGVG